MKKRFLPFLLCCLPLLATHPLVDIDLEHQTSGLRGIDCIYVINLKKREKKWLRTDAKLREYGLTANRVDAVNGWKIPKDELTRIIGPFNQYMNPGKVGCFLSHLSCLKDALDRDFDVIWVMEDDIEIVKPPAEMLRLIAQLEKVDPRWDILYSDRDTRYSDGSDFRPTMRDVDWKSPYVRLNRKKTKFPRSLVTKEIRTAGFRWGMYSAIISKRGIRKLYNRLSTWPLWTPYDHIVHYVRGIREYSSIERVVTVIPDYTISDTKRPD